MRDVNEAMAYLDSKIRDPHGGISCYHLKAELLFIIGKRKEAEKVIEDLARRWEGDRKRAYQTMSTHMLYRKEYQGSLFFMKKIIEEFPQDQVLQQKLSIINNAIENEEINL